MLSSRTSAEDGVIGVFGLAGLFRSLNHMNQRDARFGDGRLGLGDVLRNHVWFGGGGETPCIEEDGDQPVAHDVQARASSGDDPIHRHDEWNGRDDDLNGT